MQIARDILVIKGEAIVVAVRKEGQGGDITGRELFEKDASAASRGRGMEGILLVCFIGVLS